MQVQSGAMSPVSVDGSDWSGINQYQKPTDPPFSPTFSNRSNLATPPTSGVPSGTLGANGVNLNGAAPPSRLSDSGNPSPPSSVAGARSSDGTLSDQRGRRYKQMEELLSQHYSVLRRFLNAPYGPERGNRPNKARDKLLRLSPTQFHELSTDVYDELLRRQQAMPPPGRPGPPRPDVPPFLPPREDFHEKRNQARQKLASLQHQRFRDLATDVYCELERRFPQFAARDSRMASPNFGGRPSNGYSPNGYPPSMGSRRSQSRGPPSRMGRGYSGSGPGSPMGAFPPRQGSLGGPSPGGSVNGDAPLAKPFQSNTIVPNKSIMVEDDEMSGMEDDYDARSDAFALDGVLQSRRGTGATLNDGERKMLVESQSQVSSLQEKVDRLEELVKSKDEELSKKQDKPAGGEEWDGLKLELESKIAQAEELNTSLQQELEKVRMEQDSVERDLRNQLDNASRQGSGDPDLQARFADLEIKHQGLQAELQEQQQVTEEVRREATNFLMEMRAMSEQSHSNWEREERLTTEVHKLEEDVKQWKSRYAKAKTQLRHLRTSSVGISELRPDVGTFSRENELMQEGGSVKDVHVTKFQISIDELLRIARFDDHRMAMQQIKAVILAVRHVLQDVEATQHSGQYAKATRKVSATANNLITAAKNFASSSGLSPVSLLDAAASHLSTAVIELVQLVKIRPTPVEELDEETEENLAALKSPDYFSVTPSHRFSNNGSVYSAISPPSVQSRERTNSHLDMSEHGLPNGMETVPMANHGPPANDHELQELKLYVEDQTAGLVQSIQSLVASIRAEENLTAIQTHVSAISSIVTNVSSSTERFIHNPEANTIVRERSTPIVHTLDSHRGRLVDTATEGEDASSPEQLREVTNKLPPIAFEIARNTKELVQRLDMANYEDDEDDFR